MRLLKETHIYKELPPQEVENTERMKVIMMVLGGHIEIGDPLMKEDILAKVGGPLTEEDTLMEDLLEEDILMEMEDPLEEEDTMVEVPLIEMEDPLVMEDLLVMEDPLDLLVDRDHWALRATWTSKAYNSTNSPGDAGYIGFRKYLQFCWTVNAAVSKSTRSD